MWVLIYKKNVFLVVDGGSSDRSSVDLGVYTCGAGKCVCRYSCHGTEDKYLPNIACIIFSFAWKWSFVDWLINWRQILIIIPWPSYLGDLRNGYIRLSRNISGPKRNDAGRRMKGSLKKKDLINNGGKEEDVHRKFCIRNRA